MDGLEEERKMDVGGVLHEVGRPLRGRSGVAEEETKMFSIWIMGQRKWKNIGRVCLLAILTEESLDLIDVVKINRVARKIRNDWTFLYFMEFFANPISAYC
jgi:hypothetical protein